MRARSTDATFFVILVRSTSFILLQGVPSTVSLEDVRKSILDVDGVLSLHELHIWQLSENKIVASVHVTASRNHDFMPVASSIRKALHHHGIHSSTIQPEYHHPKNAPPEEHLKASIYLLLSESKLHLRFDVLDFGGNLMSDPMSSGPSLQPFRKCLLRSVDGFFEIFFSFSD